MTDPARRIRSRITTLGTIAVVVGLGAVLTLTTTQALAAARDQDTRYGTELAQQVADHLQQQVAEPVSSARDLAAVLEAHATSGQADRTLADAQLRSVLSRHSSFVGIWTGWEPNAFDGQDRDYLFDDASDSSGRYIPYWIRGKDTLSSTPLVGYRTPGVGDYYQLARTSGREQILEPYAGQQSGRSVLLTTVSEPIKVKGRVAGVAGVDVSLADVQKYVATAQPLPGGRVELVSAAGLVLAHPDPAMVGTTADAALRTAAATLAAGSDPRVTRDYSDLIGEQALVVDLPVQLTATTTWTARVTLPLSAVDAGVTHARNLTLGVAAVALLVVVALGLAVARTSRRTAAAADPGPDDGTTTLADESDTFAGIWALASPEPVEQKPIEQEPIEQDEADAGPEDQDTSSSEPNTPPSDLAEDRAATPVSVG